MAAPTHYPQAAAERLIATTIASTWLLWLLGALYIVGPVLGWTLAAMRGGFNGSSQHFILMVGWS